MPMMYLANSEPNDSTTQVRDARISEGYFQDSAGMEQSEMEWKDHEKILELLLHVGDKIFVWGYWYSTLVH
jgi:hypothetical protein